LGPFSGGEGSFRLNPSRKLQVVCRAIFCKPWCTDNVRSGSTVEEELLDSVTELAVGGKVAEVSLEVIEVKDVFDALADAFGAVSHEGSD